MTVEALGAVVVVLALFCLWHASATLGTRPTLAFLMIAVVTSWAFEEMGVITGLVYGAYHYTSALGPWVGSVPVLVPLAWFALAYATFALVDVVAGRWIGGTPGSRDRVGLAPAPTPAGRDGIVGRTPSADPGSRGRLVGLAVVGATLMAAWDLVLDPILSGPDYHAWAWGTGPIGAAVPVQNSLGWMATAFAIYALFGVTRRHTGGRAARRTGPRRRSTAPPVAALGE